MNRFALVTLLALPAVVTPRVTPAQVSAPLAVRAYDNPRASVERQPTAARHSPYETPGRVVLGLGGAVVGVMGGATFGGRVLYDGKCACEDPGLEEAIVGAAVGAVLASAVFASLPTLGSTCSQLERVGLGIGGSLAGALVGGVIGAAVGGPGVVFGYMGGAGLGAGLTASACKR